MEDRALKIVAQSNVEMGVMAFDISPDGTRAIATGLASMREMAKPQAEQQLNAQVFDVKGFDFKFRCVVSEPENGKFDRPFSTKFTPDGSSALVLNGLGMHSGKMDDVLVVDMQTSTPAVTSVVSQVSDGMESVAVHPSGKFALVACLGEHSGRASCLATIDLTTKRPRLLNHIPVEHYPEGLEFSPDGSQLFVGGMFADRIVVFDVTENASLQRKPYVIHTGRMPGSMAVSRRFRLHE